jgi:hypothetical protein
MCTGARIKEILDERGIRAIWLASKMGVSRQSLGNWLNCKYVMPTTRVEQAKSILLLTNENFKPESEGSKTI